MRGEVTWLQGLLAKGALSRERFVCHSQMGTFSIVVRRGGGERKGCTRKGYWRGLELFRDEASDLISER